MEIPSSQEAFPGREDVEERPTDVDCCLLCLEAPTSPWALPCHHVFCSQCLTEYMEDYSPPDNSIEGLIGVRCPTCLQTDLREDLTPEAENRDSLGEGTHDRKDSKHSSIGSSPQQWCDVCTFTGKYVETEVHCSKCLLNLCGECKEVHGNHVLFRSHPVVHIANKDSVAIYCDAHNSSQSHYFCHDCQRACCTVCLLQEHSGHHSCTLMDALSLRKDKIKSQLDIMGCQLDKIESKLKTLTQIGERRTFSGNPRYDRSVSEPGQDLNQSIDSQTSDGYCELRVEGSESECTQLLPPTIQVSYKDERTTKRKRSSIDLQKKPIRRLSSAGGSSRRKLSFFDNLKGKKGPPVEAPLFSDVQKPAKENSSPKEDLRKQFQACMLPSPRIKRKPSKEVKRKESIVQTALMTPWHQFIRMGKTSPVVQRKRVDSVISNPEKEFTSLVHDSPAAFRPVHLDTHIPVDMAQVGRSQFNLQLLRKLYCHAAKTVSAKKFIESYDETLQRLVSANEVEVIQLKAKVTKMLEKQDAAMQSLAMTPSSSFNSLDHMPAPRRKHTPPSSSEDRVDGAIATYHRPINQLSLLLKPQLLWKTEKHKSDPGDLWNRCGIAFLPDGNTVVAEYDMNNVKNNRLHIYDQKGVTVRVICEEQMRPLGVAVTPEGHIAVTDCKSKRVKVVTQTGAPVAEWGKGIFGWPHGIAINSKGQFIVSDAFNDFVSIHHSDGKRIKQIGSSGSDKYGFRNPFHIAVDHDDNIIVSDCGNNCIKVFNKHGEFLFSNRGVSQTSLDGFDMSGKNRRLKGPRGVAVDPKGNILVADDSSRVCMFDSRGRYIRNVLTEEEHVKLSDEEHVKFVEGMAMNRYGVLALTECNPTQMFAVKVFNIYESS